MLFLGVPVDGSLTKTHVENNQQRIYSRDSFEELACGFDNIQIVNAHYGFSACTPTNCKRGAWQNQLSFILHKGNHSA
jgi:hypothetical protein